MFTYDKENHKGYENGVLVPSITELLNYMFPLGNINSNVLKKASDRGTKVHNDIEMFNKGEIAEPETLEGEEFVKMLELMELRVASSEEQVCYYVNGEVVCYGTLDLILVDKEQNRIISDIKTVSDFDNEKVAWQINFYRIMHDQFQVDNFITKASGIWLRGWKAQYRELEMFDDEIVEKKLLELVKLWRKERGE